MYTPSPPPQTPCCTLSLVPPTRTVSLVHPCRHTHVVSLVRPPRQFHRSDCHLPRACSPLDHPPSPVVFCCRTISVQCPLPTTHEVEEVMAYLDRLCNDVRVMLQAPVDIPGHKEQPELVDMPGPEDKPVS